MNYVWHAAVADLFSQSAITLATPHAVPQVEAPLEKRQRCKTGRRFFGLALFASVCAALVLPASQAEATNVTFVGNVGYTITGASVVLTAATIQNLSTNTTSGSLRMELWAFGAPYYSGSTNPGYKLAQYQLAPLAPGFEYTNVSSGTIAYTPPPAGTWYFVMFLTEYTAASADEGYSFDGWVTFPNPVVIGPPPPTATNETFVGNVGYSETGGTVVLTADRIQNNSPSGTSGTLRMELWAVAAPYSGGGVTGYKLAEYQLAPLAAGFGYPGVNSGTVAFTPPPDGVWYFVMFLTEYLGTSANDDGFVIDDWRNFPGTVTVGNPSPPQTTTAVEYYYAAWNFYFVTAGPSEIAALDGGAFGGLWKRTGQQFNVYPLAGAPASSSTVWRFFSTIFDPKSSHFYTANVAEYNALVAEHGIGWALEGPVFSTPLPANDGTCPVGSIPIFRMYNNGMGGAPNHRFTTDINVRAQMLAAGWIPEGQGIGVGFCSPQ